ncbi:MAG: hypothetical protein WA137_05680 [Methanothrix sp.]
MSKRSIQFACVLFMLAAILAVSAQENTTTLNNATMNNTTLLNNTTINATISEPVGVAANETVIEAPIESVPAAIEIIPAQNETAPAQDTNLSENVTAVAEPVSSIPAVLQQGATQIVSPQRAVFAIGGSGTSPSSFSIDGKSLAQGAYEVGLPAKTIMDLSAMPFFVNNI